MGGGGGEEYYLLLFFTPKNNFLRKWGEGGTMAPAGPPLPPHLCPLA